MTSKRKAIAAVTLLATIATGIAPAYAAPAAGGWDGLRNDQSAFEQQGEYHRRWRRHRHRVDAGDVITGIGILAGIAIIADAASKGDRRTRGDRYPDERRYPEPVRGDYRDGGLENAVSVCSDAAERSADDTRVGEITSARRDGEGWLVSGTLEDARSFDCGVRGGQVDFIQLGGPRGEVI